MIDTECLNINFFLEDLNQAPFHSDHSAPNTDYARGPGSTSQSVVEGK